MHEPKTSTVIVKNVPAKDISKYEILTPLESPEIFDGIVVKITTMQI